MGSNSCHQSSVQFLSRFLFILVFIFFGMQRNVFAQAVENVFKSKTLTWVFRPGYAAEVL